MTDERTIAQIWSRQNRTRRWHELWIEHLALRNWEPDRALDGDLELYRHAAEKYRNAAGLQWDREIEQAERQTRHEVVAALQVFNQHAGADSAHLGLASSDIVDPTTQGLLLDSLALIIEHAVGVAQRMGGVMLTHRDTKLVARIHGRPAQLSTYGHRWATLLGPLLDWIERALETTIGYPMRPPTGAVGTAADLERVLGGHRDDGEASSGPLGGQESHSGVAEGTEAPSQDAVSGRTAWEGPVVAGDQILGEFDHQTGEERAGKDDAGNAPPDEVWRAEKNTTFKRYMGELAAKTGFFSVMDVSRQTYHRSYDSRVLSLLSELASMAQTFANDRRLEVMLGLGNEAHQAEQSASSSMPQKLNCRFSERISGLAVVTRGYVNTCGELAGMEWLEGDVSTSAARKLVLPAAFQTADDMLANWAYVIELWQVDGRALLDETWIHRYEWASAAIMQLLVDAGVSRSDAHLFLRLAWRATRDGATRRDLADQFETELVQVLKGHGVWREATHDSIRGRLQRVIADLLSEPIGNIEDQIDWLAERVVNTKNLADEWSPQVNP